METKFRNLVEYSFPRHRLKKKKEEKNEEPCRGKVLEAQTER